MPELVGPRKRGYERLLGIRGTRAVTASGASWESFADELLLLPSSPTAGAFHQALERKLPFA